MDYYIYATHRFFFVDKKKIKNNPTLHCLRSYVPRTILIKNDNSKKKRMTGKKEGNEGERKSD